MPDNLVLLFVALELVSIPTYIITTPNLHPSMATRALIEFMRDELGKLEVFAAP